MAITYSQVISWRKEYLQELKDTLIRAASNNYLEQILERVSPEETMEEIGEDGLAYVEFIFLKFIPYLSFLIFYEKNNPLSDKGAPAEKGRYPRYELSEVFDFISGMTNYGKYHLINQFPGDDDTFSVLQRAIFSNEKDVFLEEVKNRNVDFTDLRQRISASMFSVFSIEELINRIHDGFARRLSENEEEDAETFNEDEGTEVATDYFGFLLDHVSPTTREVAESVKKVYLELIGLGEDEEVDKERLHLLSQLRFPEDWLWGLFLGGAFEFCFLSLINDDILTDSEYAIVNAFFDDSKTNRMLYEMEKSMYVLSDGEFFPKRLFIPQPLRREIENGDINSLIRIFNSDSSIGVVPVNQEQPVVQTADQEPSGEGEMDGQPEATHFPTYYLPRDEKWTKCGFYKTSDDNHYIKTTLQSARMVTQDQIESLFYALVNVGCLDNKEDVLLALAVRLTGRKLLPEPIPPIEWLGEPAELDYLIFRLTPEKQKPQYARYKHFYKDYNPDGAARRAVSGYVREAVIECLNEILPTKKRV